MLSKTSYITWDTVVPDTLTNTYLKLHWAGILARRDYGPSSLLVTILYTKCFFLISVCVTTKLKRVMKNWRGLMHFCPPPRTFPVPFTLTVTMSTHLCGQGSNSHFFFLQQVVFCYSSHNPNSGPEED